MLFKLFFHIIKLNFIITNIFRTFVKAYILAYLIVDGAVFVFKETQKKL